MKISRRRFLQSSALITTSIIVDSASADVIELNQSHPLNIIQGPTNETITQIAVDVPKSQSTRYELVEIATGRIIDPELLGKFYRSFSQWRIEHVRFSGLILGHDYQLRVFNAAGKLLDHRILAPLDTNKINPRLVTLSCMLDSGNHIDEMWSSVSKSKPDLLFLLGDNAYGDILSTFHGPRILWSRYISTRKKLPLYHWERLVPAIAIWDDHDFGHNNVDGHYEHKDNALDCFRSFYAQENIPGFFEGGPTISSALHLFGHDILFLDGRYNRNLNGVNGKTFLGDEQFSWLEKSVKGQNPVLSNGTAPLMIASGSQFFGNYQETDQAFEAVNPDEFARFRTVFASANRPVIFHSGDLHYSEIMQLKRGEFGLDTYELTSSCLHSRLDKYLPDNNRRLEGTLKENFFFIDLDSQRPTYDVTCIGRHEKVRFKRKIKF